MKRFGDPHRRTWASDHERARQRSAERLSLPLPAPEAAWLRSHLAVCPACVRVAAQYEAQRDELRELQAIDPPRDLWARTSTVLDGVDRELARSVLPPSAARTSTRRRPTRSIRSIRAERHALAAGRMRGPGVGRLGRGLPRTTGNPRWAIPFATLAAFAIVVATGGGVLLTVGLPTGPAPSGEAPFTADGSRPGATPITIDAAQVAWLSPNLSGGYSLNVAQVDQVCPEEARQDCAPIEQAETQALPAFSAQPGAVVRSPSQSELVVVDRAARSGGGNIYVVAIPSAVETPRPTPVATVVPTIAATVTPEPTAEPTVEPTPEPTPFTTPEPSGVAIPPASSEPSIEPSVEPSASVEPSVEPSITIEPSPTATATAIAIISDVVLVGESAAYSADGSMFAFSARPSDGSHGPDIYLWRVGDAAATPVTADHGSIFSGWAGNLILGSRAIVTATPQPTPTPDPSASPPPDATAPAESEQPATSEEPAEASPGASVSAWAAEAAVAIEVIEAPDRGISSARHLPAAAEPSPIESAAPSVDPSSTASLAASPDASTPPSGEPSADPLASPSETPSEAPSASTESTDTAVPVSFLFDPATGTETSLAATPAWRPVVDPSGRFVVYWSGTLRYDAAALAWVPAAGQLLLASWPAFSSPDVVEVPAVPLLDGDPDGAPTGAWDARWDTDGDHLAVWVADASDPSIGRLNLLAIDASAAALGPPMLLLQDEPALPGFSISEDRLVWATPPGQDGEGSRLQVLAWSGEHAGQIVSEPVTGGNAVIVVQ